jgi:hypothetical protein
MSRTLAPLPVMVGRGSRNTIKWLKTPSALVRLRESARYLNSEEGINDTWEVRESRVRSDITVIMSIFQNEATAKVFPRIVDIFVKMVVGEKSDPA